MRIEEFRASSLLNPQRRCLWKFLLTLHHKITQTWPAGLVWHSLNELYLVIFASDSIGEIVPKKLTFLFEIYESIKIPCLCEPITRNELNLVQAW